MDVSAPTATATVAVAAAAAALRIHPADIFLFERWDHSSPLSPDEQRAALFAEFVRMGIHGRYPYHEQLRGRYDRYLASSLPPADQALLARVRHLRERAVEPPIWLRTCYRDGAGHSTDAAHEALLKGSWMEFNAPLPHHTQVFDDSTLYDDGPGGWQRIFTRIPELLENGYDPESYDQLKADAIQGALEAEEEEDAELEEQGYTKSEDGMDWTERYEYVQYASVVGVIWVADDEALRHQQLPESGKLLIAWFDDCGRVVRWNRMRSAEIDTIMGLIMGGCERDHEAWITAEVGEDYGWEGVCGPPYEARDWTESETD